MLYFKQYPFNYSSSLVVLHSYLGIWVNYCSIISHKIIYLKVLKRWISILNLAKYFDLKHFQSLCSLLTCLHLTLCCFGLLRAWTSSRSTHCRLVLTRLSQPFCFVSNTSTRSAHCSVVSGGYLNTLTFDGPCKLLSSLPIEFPSLMFHSPELFEYSTFFSSL